MRQTLVERLRENALIKAGEAWRRQDGGQDLSIGSQLAEEAADRIEALEGVLRDLISLPPGADRVWAAYRAEQLLKGDHP